MNISIRLFNLWFFFFIGYGLIWGLMIIASRKRGKAIEDDSIYNYVSKTKMIIFGFVPHILSFIWSVFVGINSRFCFFIGLAIFIQGITINIIAIFSFFHNKKGLNTTGVYKYSRNPMYVGVLFFLLGLNIIGFSFSLVYFIFLFSSLIWCFGIHWCVLQEEGFLKKKYGNSFQNYLKNVPRYL